jgi:hypothetical protein
VQRSRRAQGGYRGEWDAEKTKGTQFFLWLLPLVDLGNFLFRDPSLLKGRGGLVENAPYFLTKAAEAAEAVEAAEAAEAEEAVEAAEAGEAEEAGEAGEAAEAEEAEEAVEAEEAGEAGEAAEAEEAEEAVEAEEAGEAVEAGSKREARFNGVFNNKFFKIYVDHASARLLHCHNSQPLT